MFRPNARDRKLLMRARVAYIYKDGVVVIEEKEIGPRALRTRVEIVHIYPGEIRLHSVDYMNGRDFGPVRSIVVHYPRWLCSGVEAVKVAYGNSSPASKDAGVPDVTTVLLYAPNGLEVADSQMPFFVAHLAAKPNPQDYSYGEGTDTIESWRNEEHGGLYPQHIEVHA